MPLLTCQDCGKEHSNLAPACPNCGRPNQMGQVEPMVGDAQETLINPIQKDSQPKTNGCIIGCLTFIGLIAMIAVIGSLVPKSTIDSTPSTKTETSVLAPPKKPIAPAGWNTTDTEGVYWRWCTNDPECSSDKVIGDNSYNLMQVWCKEKACGDIYGRVNLISSSGVVVGWTNDTGYGDVGQKVQLTFDSYQEDWETARLTELNISQ